MNTKDPIDNAGPDTLRKILREKMEENEKMRELLQFAKDAAKSSIGNLIALDARLKPYFDELVKQRQNRV